MMFSTFLNSDVLLVMALMVKLLKMSSHQVLMNPENVRLRIFLICMFLAMALALFVYYGVDTVFLNPCGSLRLI